MRYLRSVAVLFVIALAASFALTFTFSNTKPIIDRIKKERQDAALKKILPQAEKFKEKKFGDALYFEGIKNDKVVGRVFKQSQKAYAADPIVMLVGVASGKVTLVEILEQKETPGLGDKIKDEWFREQFKGKTIKDKLLVKQDIDSLTGATISSKAVTNGVKEALKQNQKLEKKSK